MPSVLYILNSGMIGGANRAMLGLFEHMDRRKFCPVAVVPESGPMRRELEARDVHVFSSDVLNVSCQGGKVAQGRLLWQLRKVIKSQKPAILHANDPLTYRLPSVATLGRRIRRMCHFQLPPKEDVLSWAFRVRPHRVITCSVAMMKKYAHVVEKLAPKSRISTARNFADLTRYKPGKPSAQLLKELNTTEDTIIVSIIGLVSERKGHPDFLEMAARLLRTHSREQICFLVVGDDILKGGAYLQAMRLNAVELGIEKSVHFMGFRNDVADILRITDIAVLPSRNEGLPLSIAEAMACSIPVVAYDIPGVAEIVQHGHSGILAPVGEVCQLTEAVGRLANDRETRRKMGEAGRLRVEGQFSAAAHTATIEAIYEEELGAI